MNRILKTLSLAVCGLLLNSAGHSETLSSVTSLNCTRSDGSTLTAHAFAYSLDAGPSNPRYFAIYAYGSDFFEFTYEEYFGSGYSYCSLANMPGTLAENVTVADVTAYGVGANVGAGSVGEDPISQTYTLVTFAFTFIQIGSNAVKAGPETTPEQKAHALEMFKASIPPLIKR